MSGSTNPAKFLPQNFTSLELIWRGTILFDRKPKRAL